MEKTYHPISLIADKLQLEEVSFKHSNEEKFEELARYLDRLIQSDFNSLLSILYRNFLEKKAGTYLYRLEKKTIELVKATKEVQWLFVGIWNRNTN